MMKSWKKLFASHILQRGKAYYEDDAVENLSYDNGVISADVFGSEIYQVSIETDNDSFFNFFCTCPYAEDGTKCKHMAAVLYAFEENEEGIVSEAYGLGKEDIEKIINELPEAKVRSLLCDIVTKEKKYLDSILILENSSVSADQKSKWMRELALIKKRQEKNHSYRSYYYDDPYEFATELSAFLDDHVHDLIEEELHSEALDLIFAVYDIAFDEVGDIYCNENSLLDVLEECMSYCRDILDRADEDFQKEMYEKILSRCGGRLSSDNDDILQNFLLYDFEGEYFARSAISLIDKELKHMPENDRYLADLVMKRISFSEQAGLSGGEIEAFADKYRYLPEIRIREIDALIENGSKEEAIKLLKESKAKDAADKMLLSKYYKCLIELYEQLERKNECINEIMEYIFNCMQNDLIYVNKLKSLLHEDEWSVVLEQLLHDDNLKFIRLELLESEKQYARLFKEIKKTGNMYALNRYEHILKGQFSDEIRDIYLNYANKQMIYASGRGVYAEIAKILKKIQKYPGGNELAENLVKEWKIKYKRRSAMMEELKKAGF